MLYTATNAVKLPNRSRDAHVAQWEVPWEKYSTPQEALVHCKYITVEDRRGRIVMLIFDASLQHNAMYIRKFGGRGVISAGFITYVAEDKTKLLATGKSTSIAGEPVATILDTKLVNLFLGFKQNEHSSPRC